MRDFYILDIAAVSVFFLPEHIQTIQQDETVNIFCWLCSLSSSLFFSASSHSLCLWSLPTRKMPFRARNEHEVREIVKPRTDKRDYRRIVLHNALEVLFISYPETDKVLNFNPSSFFFFTLLNFFCWFSIYCMLE